MESILLNVATLEEQQRHQINMLDEAKHILKANPKEMENKEMGNFTLHSHDPYIDYNMTCFLT